MCIDESAEDVNPDTYSSSASCTDSSDIDKARRDYVEQALCIEGRRSRAVQRDSPRLRPLPNQRYRKQHGDAEKWEGVLQKRLVDDVKDKEMRLSISQILSSESERSVATKQSPTNVVNIDIGSVSPATVDQQPLRTKTAMVPQPSQSQAFRGRVVTSPWFGDGERKALGNPAYSSYTTEPGETELHAMMSSTASNSQKRPGVSSRIALFENIASEQKRSRSKSPNHSIVINAGVDVRKNRSASVDVNQLISNGHRSTSNVPHSANPSFQNTKQYAPRPPRTAYVTPQVRPSPCPPPPTNSYRPNFTRQDSVDSMKMLQKSANVFQEKIIIYHLQINIPFV